MIKAGEKIDFVATPYVLKGFVILRLPDDVSKKLPSRSQVAVRLTIGGLSLDTLLEPDGYLGHYMKARTGSAWAQKVSVGEGVSATFQLIDDWPEPVVDRDIMRAINVASEKVQRKWRDITPRARTEWVRWVNSTANANTRQVRIEKTVSKLDGKHRRPCCFNLAACTDVELAHTGRLILPDMI